MKNEYLRSNIILCIIATMLAIFQVMILNQYSTRGQELTTLNKNIQELVKENTKLSQAIASASSLTTISTKALTFGFTKNTSLISISTPMSIAYTKDLSL